MKVCRVPCADAAGASPSAARPPKASSARRARSQPQGWTGVSGAADEVAYARRDRLAPAPAAEDAVVADPGNEVVAAPLRRDAGAERVRGLGLAVAGDVVELPLDRQERSLRDRVRPH